MGRRVVSGVAGGGLVVTVVMMLLQLLVVVLVLGGHHVVAVGHGYRDAAQVKHSTAAAAATGGALRRRTGVRQRHGEVGTAADGHVVDLRLRRLGSDVKVGVQAWLMMLLLMLLVVGRRGNTPHPSSVNVRLYEDVVDGGRHAEDGGEVWQCLGGGREGAGHLQPRLRLDLMRREVLGGVGPVEARAEVGGAGQDDVDVEAVRGGGLVVGEVLVHHRGALPSVLLVQGVDAGIQEETVDLREVLVQF